MPITKHLNRFDITDFTGGLNDVLGDSTLLQIGQAPQFRLMTDYEPIAGGGARAWYKGDVMVTTGIASPSTELPMGIFARGNVANRAGGADGVDVLLATIDNVDFKSRLYRMDGSNNEVVWKLVWRDAAGATSAGFIVSEFGMFVDDAGTPVTTYLWVKRTSPSAGVYEVPYLSTNTFPTAGVVNNYSYQGPIATSQARVMMCEGGKLHYTNVGVLTGAAANTLRINPNDVEATIGLLMERAPADLLIGLQGSPWYEINGDVSSASTPVRSLGDDHHIRQHYQKGCRVPGGIAFIEPGGRIYITDGQNFKSISDSIARFPGVGGVIAPGQLAFLNDYLFAPGGRVFSFRTNSWHTSTLLTTSAFHHAVQSGRVYMTNCTATPAPKILRLYEGTDSSIDRMSTGIIQTLPFRDPTGRNVRIREVQILAQTYTSSGFAVSLLDSTGATVSTDTVTGVTGRGQVTLRFPNTEDEYLSVKVTPSATNGTSEAPTIECLSIFFGPNNAIQNAAS